jgi:hypothetical protein
MSSQPDAKISDQKSTYDRLLATTSQPLLHIDAESQDPNHMTIKKGGPKGTSKARSVPQVGFAYTKANVRFTAPEIPVARMWMAILAT